MTVRTDVVADYVLQEALSAYSDEAYTTARKLSGTGIVGSNPLINKDTETFVGQLRWFKPMNPNINVASLTDPTDGTTTSHSSAYQRYVKTVRTTGARNVNLKDIITQQDGLAKYGRDFGEFRAQDEHNAILSVLKGVAISELLNGAASGSGSTGLGGQTFDNDPTDKRYGFYVDMGISPVVSAPSASHQGAARAEAFLRALGMAYKDYEPEYVYLVTSPEVLASLRSANLVDQTKVTEGNIMFDTIFQGKFRLIQTRARQSLTSAELLKANTGGGVDVVGTKTSFIVLPGALAMEQLTIPVPVEIERKAAAYKGGGTTEIWNRWGYVVSPAGYDWNGADNAFPSDAEYMGVRAGTTLSSLADATDALANTSGVWARKATSALSLGIFPIFHG